MGEEEIGLCSGQTESSEYGQIQRWRNVNVRVNSKQDSSNL